MLGEAAHIGAKVAVPGEGVGYVEMSERHPDVHVGRGQPLAQHVGMCGELTVQQIQRRRTGRRPSGGCDVPVEEFAQGVDVRGEGRRVQQRDACFVVAGQETREIAKDVGVWLLTMRPLQRSHSAGAVSGPS